MLIAISASPTSGRMAASPSQDLTDGYEGGP
jgi:hypothetical protein